MRNNDKTKLGTLLTTVKTGAVAAAATLLLGLGSAQAATEFNEVIDFPDNPFDGIPTFTLELGVNIISGEVGGCTVRSLDEELGCLEVDLTDVFQLVLQPGQDITGIEPTPSFNTLFDIPRPNPDGSFDTSELFFVVEYFPDDIFLTRTASFVECPFGSPECVAIEPCPINDLECQIIGEPICPIFEDDPFGECQFIGGLPSEWGIAVTVAESAAVPLPASGLLLVGGLGAAVAMRRKKKRG